MMSGGEGVNGHVSEDHLPKDSDDGAEHAGGVPAPSPCPECAAGKHGNCDGRTWDNLADDYAVCPCSDAGH
jgi:hypothetical protein